MNAGQAWAGKQATSNKSPQLIFSYFILACLHSLSPSSHLIFLSSWTPNTSLDPQAKMHLNLMIKPISVVTCEFSLIFILILIPETNRPIRTQSGIPIVYRYHGLSEVEHRPLPVRVMLALGCRVLPPQLTIASTSSTLRRLSFSTFTSHMPVHPPNPRPSDWKSAAPSPPAGTITFSAQSTLPKLPVLPLVPTLERLKTTLVPIAHTPAELADAHRKIDAFANGIGPELQHRLEGHALYKPQWLEEWWDDSAYLSYRDSVRRSPFIRGCLSADRHVR